MTLTHRFFLLNILLFSFIFLQQNIIAASSNNHEIIQLPQVESLINYSSKNANEELDSTISFTFQFHTIAHFFKIFSYSIFNLFKKINLPQIVFDNPSPFQIFQSSYFPLRI